MDRRRRRRRRRRRSLDLHWSAINFDGNAIIRNGSDFFRIVLPGYFFVVVFTRCPTQKMRRHWPIPWKSVQGQSDDEAILTLIQ